MVNSNLVDHAGRVNRDTPLVIAAYFAWMNHVEEQGAKNALNSLSQFITWDTDAVEMDRLLSRCQSPAERLYVVGFCMAAEHTSMFEDEPVMTWSFDDISGGLSAQPEVANIHPDFAVGVGGYRLFVEIDGHEFHVSTKQQVARDRQRERAIAAGGDVVIRFTASEVYKDPRRCGLESIRIATQLARRVA